MWGMNFQECGQLGRVPILGSEVSASPIIRGKGRPVTEHRLGIQRGIGNYRVDGREARGVRKTGDIYGNFRDSVRCAEVEIDPADL